MPGQGQDLPQKRERKHFMSGCPAPPPGGGKMPGQGQALPLLYTMFSCYEHSSPRYKGALADSL